MRIEILFFFFFMIRFFKFIKMRYWFTKTFYVYYCITLLRRKTKTNCFSFKYLTNVITNEVSIWSEFNYNV